MAPWGGWTGGEGPSRFTEEHGTISGSSPSNGGREARANASPRSPRANTHETQLENVMQSDADDPADAITVLEADDGMVALQVRGVIFDGFHRFSAKCWGGDVVQPAMRRARLWAARRGSPL